MQPSNRVRVEGSPTTQGTGESLPRALDAAPYLEDSEVIDTLGTPELLCLSTGADYSAEGLGAGPVINNTTQVVQFVEHLEARRAYLLRCPFTTDTGRTWVMELEICCYS